MIAWPEKVRAALLATAQNVDLNYWSYQENGRDGAGVISGSEAVWFARKHTTVYPNNTAVPYGSLGASNQGSTINYNILIPPTKPAGKHLRIVLTWDSSPSLTDAKND